SRLRATRGRGRHRSGLRYAAGKGCAAGATSGRSEWQLVEAPTLRVRGELMKLAPVLVALVWSLAAYPQRREEAPAASWWEHMQVLASDELEGRLPGTLGHRKAVQYVAGQFRQAKLKSAGSGGYFQRGQFVRRQIDEHRSTLELVRNGKAEMLDFAEDAYLLPVTNLASRLETSLVFVGYGLTIPEKGIDDLSGLDVKGKVLVYLFGAPSSIKGPLSARAQSIGQRWKAAKAAGAV